MLFVSLAFHFLFHVFFSLSFFAAVVAPAVLSSFFLFLCIHISSHILLFLSASLILIHFLEILTFFLSPFLLLCYSFFLFPRLGFSFFSARSLLSLFHFLCLYFCLLGFKSIPSLFFLFRVFSCSPSSSFLPLPSHPLSPHSLFLPPHSFPSPLTFLPYIRFPH